MKVLPGSIGLREDYLCIDYLSTGLTRIERNRDPVIIHKGGIPVLVSALAFCGSAVAGWTDASVDRPPIPPARTARLFYPLIIAYIPALAWVLSALAR